MQLRRLLAPALLALAAGLASAQTTYYVDAVFGNDANNGLTPATAFQHINVGIGNATVLGDTVEVAPGVYSPAMGEWFPIGTISGISVVGRDPRTTIIDADSATQGYTGDVIHIASNSVFSGFTVMNAPHGSVNWWSGAIHIDDFNGGGIQVSNVTVERCIVDTTNRPFYVGNPWDCIIDNIHIRNNFIVRCSADAIGFFADANNSALSIGNVIENNTILGGDPAHVIRDTIWLQGGITATIRNNNLCAYDNSAIGVAGGTHVLDIHYNNFFGTPGPWGGYVWVDPNNTNATVNETNTTYNDPLVVDPQGDPHLLSGSPCVDAGDPTMAATDDIDGNSIYGMGIDQGCDEKLVNYAEAEFYAWPIVAGGQPTKLTYLGQPGDGSVLFAAVTLSISGPLNLGSLGFLYIDPLAMMPFAAPVTLDASGLAQVTVPIPPSLTLMGPSIYLQSLNFNSTLTQLGLSDLEELSWGM